MAKYSFEFKLSAVTAYLNGEGGYTALTKKFGVKDTSQLRRWVNAYKKFGEKGLIRTRTHNIYTSEFKQSVVESYLTSELSYQQIALQYGLTNPSLIARWKTEFIQHGVTAFIEKPKGRASTMKKTDSKKLKVQPKKPILRKKNQTLTPEQERILELEKQLRYAHIEIAYLKELRRLRLEDARKMKEQQESLAVSEESSD